LVRLVQAAGTLGLPLPVSPNETVVVPEVCSGGDAASITSAAKASRPAAPFARRKYAMSEPKKPATYAAHAQDPHRLATPGRKREAEKINAISSLQRAARRCAKHLGRSCVAGLLELVRSEFGARRWPTRSKLRVERRASTRGKPRG